MVWYLEWIGSVFFLRPISVPILRHIMFGWFSYLFPNTLFCDELSLSFNKQSYFFQNVYAGTWAFIMFYFPPF